MRLNIRRRSRSTTLLEENRQPRPTRDLLGEGRLLRIFIGEADRWQAQPLHTAIVERLHQQGLAGATVIRGIHGFGADSHLHASRGLRLSHDLPIVIEIVDTADNIDGALPLLDEMIQEGMVTIERAQIIVYRSPPDTT